MSIPLQILHAYTPHFRRRVFTAPEPSGYGCESPSSDSQVLITCQPEQDSILFWLFNLRIQCGTISLSFPTDPTSENLLSARILLLLPRRTVRLGGRSIR